MTPVTFRGYGVQSPKVAIVVERITHFYQIDYNGRYGTCIVLDTGKEVKVEAWPSEVGMAIRQAKEAA